MKEAWKQKKARPGRHTSRWEPWEPTEAAEEPSLEQGAAGEQERAPLKKMPAEQQARALRYLQKEQALGGDTLTAKSAALQEQWRAGQHTNQEELAESLAGQTDMLEYLRKPRLAPLERRAAQRKLEEFKAVNRLAYDRYDQLPEAEKSILDRWQALEYKLGQPRRAPRLPLGVDSAPAAGYDEIVLQRESMQGGEPWPSLRRAGPEIGRPREMLHTLQGGESLQTENRLLQSQKLGKKGAGHSSESILEGAPRAKSKIQPPYAQEEWWIERAEKMDPDVPPLWLQGLTLAPERPVGTQGIREMLDRLNPKLKPAEHYLIMRHPLAAATLYFSQAEERAGIARNRVYQAYGQEGLDRDGARPNAFLHIYWNALMAYHVGEDMAEQFATAHEQYTPQQYAQGRLEEIANEGYDTYTTKQHLLMDMRNNAVGRSLVNQLPRGESPVQTQALVTAELIGRYLHGSLEEYKAVKQEYKGFSDAELLLLHYAAEAVDDGRGVWIVQDDEI